MNGPSLSEATKDLLKKHSFIPQKRFGQNFLIDKAALDRVVKAVSISKEDIVLEIGTGTGLLTKELAAFAGKVVSYEIDTRIFPIGEEYLKGTPNIELRNEDFLKEQKLLPCTFTKCVANIPYYISTPIIEKLVELKVPLIVITVQREFAERMAALPGSKDHGSFSVFVNYHFTSRIDSLIPKSSFLPQPDVGSAVVVLERRAAPAVRVKNETTFFKTVRASFGQRRKMLRNALQTVFSSEEVDAALSAGRIDGKRRGETLSMEEFALLSDALPQIENTPVNW